MTPDLDLGHTRLILDECRAQGLLRNQAAYVLATAFWETARTMQPVEEAYFLGKGKAEAYRQKLRYHPWYGRGFVQLTWQDNYKRAGEVLHLDFLTDPTLALQPDVAAKILVRGMKDGWFTGRELDDYITIKRSDFVGARRIINGTDKAQEISAIARAYDAALKADGYGEVILTPPVSREEQKLQRIALLHEQIAAILAEP